MYLFIPKKTEAFTVRLDGPTMSRYNRVAKSIGLDKAKISALAIEAVIVAVERSGGKLTLPLKVAISTSASSGDLEETG